MKKLALFLLFFTAFIIIPITVFKGVKKRQELRGRAAPATSLSLQPPSATKVLFQPFSVDVKIITGDNQIVSADIILNFDPQILEAEDITQGTFLPDATEIRKTINNTVGKIIYSIFTIRENAKSGEGILASVSFKGKATGTTMISFDPETAIYALGEGQNVLTGTNSATYIIISPLSPTPTSTPTPSQIPTITPTLTLTLTPTPSVVTLSPTPTSTFILSPTPTQAVSPSPPPTSLPPSPTPSCLEQKYQGDYNCNGVVDESDFVKWIDDFLSGKTTLSFFEYWRRAFYKYK